MATGYIFTKTGNSSTKVVHVTNDVVDLGRTKIFKGPVLIEENDSSLISIKEGGGNAMSLNMGQIVTIDGSAPAGTMEGIIDQLDAVFPKALRGGGVTNITNATRPENPTTNALYYNTDSSKYERYNGTSWEDAGFTTFPTPATPASITPTAGNAQISDAFASAANAATYQAQASSDSFSTIAGSNTGASSPIVISSLVNGTAYLTRVRGVSSRGVKGGWRTAGSAVTPVLGGTPPVLQSITIEDSNKQAIKLHYDLALDSSSIPMAGDFAIGNATQFPRGELPARITADTPVNETAFAIPSSAGFMNTLGTISFCNMWKWSRVTNAGTVTKVQFYVGDLSKVTSLKLEIWRPAQQGSSGSTFTRRCSIELYPLLTANSLNIITLPSTVDVIEDDRTGMSITCSATNTANVLNFHALSVGSDPRNGMFYQGAVAATSFINWSSLIYNDGYVPIRLIADKGADIVCLMDSWGQGYPVFAGYVNTAVNDNGEQLKVTLPYILSSKLNVSVVNMGWNGQTSDQIKARVADALARNPKAIYINCTINGGATFVQDYVDMATTIVAAGVACYIGEMGPSTAQGNSAITNNAAVKPAVEAVGAIWVDGIYAALDDGNGHLQVQYQADGNHPNQLGQGVIADKIIAAIAKHTPVLVSGNDVTIQFNRKFSYTDAPLFDYVIGTHPIRAGVGANAAAFFGQTVTNNIVLAPEDVYFDVVSQFIESPAQVWSGGWGQADKQMPKQGTTWLGFMPTHKGILGTYLLADDITAINNFNSGAFYSFAQLGLMTDGTHVWPIDAVGSGGAITINQLTLLIDTNLYYSIYREGTHFYVATSPDQITWTKIYTYVKTYANPMFVWSYAGASYPASYNFEPIGTTDHVAPTVIAATVIDTSSVIVETDEPLSAFTAAGWIPKRGTTVMPVTSVDTIPSHTLSKRYLYLLITSSTILPTDVVTLGYDATLGATTDSTGHEIVSFTGMAVTNSIQTTALDGNSVSLLKAVISSNNLYASHGVFAEVSDATDKADGLLTLYSPNGSDAIVYYDKVSNEDAVLIAFKTKNGLLPTDYTDTTAGTGYFLGSAAYAFVGANNPSSFSQVVANNVGFQWRILVNRGNNNIYLQLWNGSSYATWHNMAIASGDLEVVIYVVQGYPKNITHNGLV